MVAVILTFLLALRAPLGLDFASPVSKVVKHFSVGTSLSYVAEVAKTFGHSTRSYVAEVAKTFGHFVCRSKGLTTSATKNSTTLPCPAPTTVPNILTQTPPRRLLVALLPAYVDPLFQLTNTAQTYTTAVVIDTLRFTTTACQAISLGARSVLVAPSVERAQQLGAEMTPRPLLCGERHCHRIVGFDLGNSPLELSGPLVGGRDLVFTTTNGTLAVEAVRQVPHILLAAVVNRASTCDYLRGQTSGDVLLVCAGTDGQITWEDVLTAGAIVDRLVDSTDFETGHDAATLAQAAWRSIQPPAASTERWPQRLEKEFARALGGSNLIESGYERDVQFSAQLDSLACVVCNSTDQPQRFAMATI